MDFSYLKLDEIDVQFPLYAKQLHLLSKELEFVRYDFLALIDRVIELGGELSFLKKEKNRLRREYRKYLKSRKLEFVSECKRIEDYCKFSSGIMGRILSDIISDVEGVSYIFREVTCYENKNTKYEKKFLVWGIMKKGMKFSLIKHMKHYERYVDPHDFVLLEYKPYDMQDYIWLYQLNHADYSFNRSVDFSHFPYVWDFIDYVIQYRIQYSKLDLSYRDLEKLKDEFLCLYHEKQNSEGEKVYHL